MIFNKDKRYVSIYNELAIHTAIFISISLNLYSSNSIIDFNLFTLLIIFLSRGNQIKWHYSISILFWGFYSDLIIGYPIGYSSALFLFFLLLNQLSNFFGIFFIDSIRFFIFVIGLFFVSITEYLIIFLVFDTNTSISLQLLKILFILVFYFPLTFFIKNSFNFYASKE